MSRLVVVHKVMFFLNIFCFILIFIILSIFTPTRLKNVMPCYNQDGFSMAEILMWRQGHSP